MSARRAAPIGGVQATNAVAGTVTGPKWRRATPPIAADAARNQATNAIGNTGHGTAVDRCRGQHDASRTMVPLAAFTHFGPGNTPLAVNHQGLFVATTISFNLRPARRSATRATAISDAMLRIGVPATIHGNFQGTAREFPAVARPTSRILIRRRARRGLYRARHPL